MAMNRRRTASRVQHPEMQNRPSWSCRWGRRLSRAGRKWLDMRRSAGPRTRTALLVATAVAWGSRTTSSHLQSRKHHLQNRIIYPSTPRPRHRFWPRKHRRAVSRAVTFIYILFSRPKNRPWCAARPGQNGGGTSPLSCPRTGVLE